MHPPLHQQPLWVAISVCRAVLAGVACVLLVAGTCPARAAEGRVALVIGNSAYQSVAKLPNAANDARLVARTLSNLGFTLVGGGPELNLDKAGLDRAVQEFGVQLRGASVALFYYAGHGVQVRGNNYLVPVSANPTRETDVDFQMLDAQLVLRQMQAGNTKLNLMILDACRNNPFAGRGLRSAGGGLAEMRAPEGTLISYATQPDSVAAEGSGTDSPYTTALVEAIQKPGLGVFDMFNQVGVTVKAVTGGFQQPWQSSSPIEGQFFFVPQGSTVTIQTPPGSRNTGPAVDPKQIELTFWQSIANSADVSDFQDYLEQYPSGSFVSLARRKIAAIQKLPPAPAQQQTVVAMPPPAAPSRQAAGQLSADEAAAQADQAYSQKRYQDAMTLYRVAASQGQSASQNRLGYMYSHAEGVPQDQTLAMYWFRKAADQGNADASNNIGILYRYGEGLPPDKTQAVYWFRKAAYQGIGVAQFNLGLMYDNGEGVLPDKTQAMYWYRKAADQGNAGAANNVGKLYFNGEGVQQDNLQATTWFRLAAAKGNEEAKQNLARLGLQ